VLVGQIGTATERVFDDPVTEVQATGFSPSGRLFVIATSSDLSIFEYGDEPIDLTESHRVEIERRSAELAADPSLALTRKELWRQVNSR
jgi:hypothetical protein